MKFDPTLPAEGVNVTPTHPLSELALLVGGSVAALGGLLVALVVALDVLVPWVPVEWESRLLADLAPESLSADPRQPAVAALLARLVAHAPESPFVYRVALLEDPEPNALAFPGGLIVVTTGLLDGLTSENELAMVLGHELGHYAGRDHLQGLGRGLALALATGIATGSGDAARLAAWAGDLAVRAHGRERERAADAAGLELVYAEYGHVAGATSFFERLPEAEGDVAGRLARYLATHPLGADRVRALDALARARGWPQRGAPVRFGLPGQGSSPGHR